MEAQYSSHSYTSPYLAHTSLYLADRTPSGGGRISRITDFLEVGDTLRLAFLGGAQNIDGLLRSEGVGQVTEVKRRDELFRLHLGKEQPERLAGALGLEIPQSRKHGADGHVLDALLRAEPAQLRIAHEQIPCETHVVEQFLDVTTDKGLGHGVDGPDDDIVATADGEDESIAGITGIRGDDDVGGGVIRIRVHGIGARERGRCREPEIIRGDFGDNAHSALPWKNV